MPACTEEMARDVILFVGTRWWFMTFFFFFPFQVPQTGKGKRERGVVWCSRLVGGDVAGGGTRSTLLHLWSATWNETALQAKQS